jgi:colicin import membrane protein
MKRIAALILLLALASFAYAEEPEPPLADLDGTTLQERARTLHRQADELRQVGETEFTAAQKSCWERFLVSSCLDEAAQSQRDKKLAAAKLDSRARAMERELKRREIAEKDAKRARENAAPAKP